MPKRMKVERSPNYSYYSDILWCSLPLVGMSCYFYGLRPVLLFLAALLSLLLCLAARFRLSADSAAGGPSDRLPVRLCPGPTARHRLPVP